MSFGKNGQFLDQTIPPGRMPTETGEIATRDTNPNYGNYGWTRDGGTRPHFGIDYSGEVGDPVYAMYEGDVIKVGLGKSYGPNAVRTSVTLNSKGYNVDYGHLSGSSVSVGNHVNGRSLIGQMGRSGIPSNMPTHVHIAVWRPLTSGKMGFVEPSFYLNIFDRLRIFYNQLGF